MDKLNSNWKKIINVYRSGNEIDLYTLNHPKVASDFIRAMFYAVNKAGFSEIVIRVNDRAAIFPNASVPIASAIGFYRSIGIEVEIKSNQPLVQITHLDNPVDATNKNAEGSECLSRIWRFKDATGVSVLSKHFRDALSKRVECSNGVLEAIEWCLNEVMDNVLQHSEDSVGFIMVQIHPGSQHIAICLADTGIGIFQSLRTSKYHPRTAVDAITLALKEGVTRDPTIGQGNGLWGLLRIVGENSGTLTVTSGKGSVIYKEGGRVLHFDGIPYLSPRNQGTIIDFQLDASTSIDLSKALGGHSPINLVLEAHETKEGDSLVRVIDHATGTGTRTAAMALRNYIVNLITQGASHVIIDFGGIGVISSSFADELIGKLVVKYGFYHYQRLISLNSMSEIVQTIAHRSVAQRMAESLKSNNL